MIKPSKINYKRLVPKRTKQSSLKQSPKRLFSACSLPSSFSFSIKEIKNAPSALLSYISMRVFIKNTREVLEKHEPQANASRTSRVFLKNPKCLYNSTMYEEQVFYFFYKMYRELRALVLMT